MIINLLTFCGKIISYCDQLLGIIILQFFQFKWGGAGEVILGIFIDQNLFIVWMLRIVLEFAKTSHCSKCQRRGIIIVIIINICFVSHIYDIELKGVDRGETAINIKKCDDLQPFYIKKPNPKFFLLQRSSVDIFLSGVVI
eukprot:TRINITY_DN2283_c0_g1_i1.p3 TRINITY_DN2283_c0_g1~~TRINITY_DN2283_c0_g1_i1.p3  ORF type:complete len:141 (-),score=10.25 TRINITY_DN2283_c0_g1_i1:801-1223(-)